MSDQKHKLNGLQAGRGIAAMLVVLHHSANHLRQDFGFLPLGGVFHFGRAGVDFFFVLSGFIILFVHAKDLGNPFRLGHYLLKRITRIYPVYWAVIAILLSISIVLHKEYSLYEFFLDAILAPNAKLQTLGVAWTLQYEILFYVFFSMAIVSVRLGLMLLVVWIGIIFLHAISWLPVSGSDFINLTMSAWNIEFMLGMFSAYYLARNKLENPGVLLLFSVAGFVLTGILENFDILDGTTAFARLPYGICSMAIMMSLVEYERSKGLRVPVAFVVIGEASYSIYLLHLLCIGIAYKVLGFLGVLTGIPIAMIYLILFVFGVLGGIGFSLLVEKPLLQFSRYLTIYLKNLFIRQTA